MSYDYKKEYQIWKDWKENEEKILRKYHVDEKVIDELREFDWEQFNSERKFKRHSNITNDIFFIIQPVFDIKQVNTIENILDQIENEALFEYLRDTDPIVLKIIKLRLDGYKMKEISRILDVSISSIYRKFKKVKKFLKK